MSGYFFGSYFDSEYFGPYFGEESSDVDSYVGNVTLSGCVSTGTYETSTVPAQNPTFTPPLSGGTAPYHVSFHDYGKHGWDVRAEVEELLRSKFRAKTSLEDCSSVSEATLKSPKLQVLAEVSLTDASSASTAEFQTKLAELSQESTLQDTTSESSLKTSFVTANFRASSTLDAPRSYSKAKCSISIIRPEKSIRPVRPVGPVKIAKI